MFYQIYLLTAVNVLLNNDLERLLSLNEKTKLKTNNKNKQVNKEKQKCEFQPQNSSVFSIADY